MNAASRTEGRRRALITGIAGFTGRYLAAELDAAGYEVSGTVQAQDVGGAGHLACDLLDADRVRAVVAEVQPDVVAHLAAVSFVGHGDFREVYDTNIAGTLNLLQALEALATPPSAVLLASSANVYGNAVVDPITEDVPPAPANDYAVSKLAMEHASRLRAGRLPIVTVRPFNYTGVGQAPHFLLPKIVDHFRRGARRMELGNLDVARDFSDVRDVVVIYRRLIERAPPGTLVNVCSGGAVTLSDVLALMGEIAGYRIDVTVNPALVRANEVRRLAGDTARLQRLIGPMERTPLPATLRWMYEA